MTFSSPSVPSRILMVTALAMVVLAGVLLVIANTPPAPDPQAAAYPMKPSTARPGAASPARTALTAPLTTLNTLGVPGTLVTRTQPITSLGGAVLLRSTTAAGPTVSLAVSGTAGGGGEGRTPGDALSGTPAASRTVAAEPWPTGVTAGHGSVVPLAPLPPLFSYARPFDGRHDNRPSRYYPYGTNANGTLLLHHGVDIGNPMGAEVLAIGEGSVVYAGSDKGSAYGPQTNFYGNAIVIRHPEPLNGQALFSLYGHLSRIDVTAGQAVKRGQQIGLVGQAGIALGPHLHLEIRLAPQDYESTLNSELFLQPLPGHGCIIGRLADADGQPLTKRAVELFRVDQRRTETWATETTTYPGSHVNSLPGVGENFVFADTEAGDYVIHADLGRRVQATARVRVVDGVAVFVTLTP